MGRCKTLPRPNRISVLKITNGSSLSDVCSPAKQNCYHCNLSRFACGSLIYSPCFTNLLSKSRCGGPHYGFALIRDLAHIRFTLQWVLPVSYAKTYHHIISANVTSIHSFFKWESFWSKTCYHNLSYHVSSLMHHNNIAMQIVSSIHRKGTRAGAQFGTCSLISLIVSPPQWHFYRMHLRPIYINIACIESAIGYTT